MPPPPNKLLRVAVPLVIFAIGLGVVASVFINSSRKSPAPTPSNPAPVAPSAPATPLAAPKPDAQQPSAQPLAQTPTPPATQPPTAPAAQVAPGSRSIEGLKVKVVEAAAFAPIGSLDPSGPAMFEVQFSSNGAGIKSLSLARHFDTIKKESHTLLQSEQAYLPPATSADPNPVENVVTPMAALGIEVEGTEVSLLRSYDPARGVLPVWSQISPGAFEATIVNSAGEDILRLERRFTTAPNSYILRINQTVKNLAGRPLNIRWIQFGPNELVQDSAGYGGDRRRLRFGYLLRPELQKSDPLVSSAEFMWSRASGNVLGTLSKQTGQYDEVKPVWPNTISAKEQFRPVWVGLNNRYFGAAMMPLFDPAAGPDAKVFSGAAKVDRVLLQRYIPPTYNIYDPLIILRATSDAIAVAPGGTADVSMGLYAGPLERPLIRNEPLAASGGLDGLIVYNFGGPCGFCTFSFMTSLLLSLLHFLHDNILFDWALGIMVFVLCVRTVLHPVTKWSQIRLQRFGKQMQSMAPKQKKIQEKYAGDPQKLREEMGKLWREEGVSPTGALGCIPMFLQMPIWYAMSAMLYFAFELRHQGAFFGLFQKLVPGYPKLMGYFLGDLAEPDRFFYFGRTLFDAPLLGPISSINLLPIILGIVFFIQQKYLTPPSATPLTPEQEQQQKMMKWMMVFMFPLMMYNAPSGLALYFITNSTLGILESRYIRKHIDKYDLLKPKGPGKGPKPGGFMARLQQIAEERQKQMLKARGQQPPRKRV